MRISDWSSDVCSSDLWRDRSLPQWRDGYRPSDRRMGLLEVQLRLRRVLGVLASNDNAARRGGVCSFMALVAGDRKSVVWGKSVSVRVEIAGVGIINTKNIIISDTDRTTAKNII